MTEKAQDAIRQAQALAQRLGHPQIDAEHLAVALLAQDGGVATRVVERAGASPATLAQRLQQALERLPRVSGPGASGGQRRRDRGAPHEGRVRERRAPAPGARRPGRRRRGRGVPRRRPHARQAPRGRGRGARGAAR